LPCTLSEPPLIGTTGESQHNDDAYGDLTSSLEAPSGGRRTKFAGSATAQEAARKKIGFEIHGEQNDKFAKSIIIRKRISGR
jgi:hypothetical protein